MRTVCAWCGDLIRDGSPEGPVSHGICSRCQPIVMGRHRHRESVHCPWCWGVRPLETQTCECGATLEVRAPGVQIWRPPPGAPQGRTSWDAW
jgi:hypothetical protein